MRTKLSNFNYFIVHFFDARQRNEPKKTCTRGEPLVDPPLAVACTYGAKLFSAVASLLFLGAERMPYLVGEGSPLPLQRETNHEPFLWGGGPTRTLLSVHSEQNL